VAAMTANNLPEQSAWRQRLPVGWQAPIVCPNAMRTEPNSSLFGSFPLYNELGQCGVATDQLLLPFCGRWAEALSCAVDDGLHDGTAARPSTRRSRIRNWWRCALVRNYGRRAAGDGGSGSMPALGEC